ncbi:MAG: HAD family hydrolase [Deltaproteobacteria bacterium]|nr:HAD family hydrolase [Deltaproteobacteria bacterium]
MVIFDCDGVLFNSREANRAFYNSLLAPLGKPPLSEEALEYVHMHTVFEAVDFLFPEAGERRCAQAYRQDLDPEPFIRLMVEEPGLRELLTFLRPAVKTAISTNRTSTIGQVLSLHDLRGYFDLVVSALDVVHPKPHPESLNKIIAYFQLRPEQALYIGDSVVDAEAAQQAGIPLIAYKNPLLEADLHVESFRDLQEWLKRRGTFPRN